MTGCCPLHYNVYIRGYGSWLRSIYSQDTRQHVTAVLVVRQKCVMCAIRVGLWRIDDDDLAGWRAASL